jgi:PucR C-terminal helix-turn-helix domain/GGDEF-like domain
MLLSDFALLEAEDGNFAGHGAVLRELLTVQVAVLDRLMAGIAGEGVEEPERIGRPSELRLSECVQRLLAGGACDTVELGYELEGWHIGMIASGAGAVESLRRVAVGLGVRLLCISRGDDTAWGWLGGHLTPAIGELERVLRGEDHAGLSVAMGEPAHGVEGWRLTHRQAQAAQRVALHRPRRLTRYADVALLASVLSDDVLAASLVEIYLAPLGDRQNGGMVLRDTLRAYFAAECNASSAACALGVARHTVEKRLRAIEEKLGHALRTRQAELEVALRVEDLGDESPGETFVDR